MPMRSCEHPRELLWDKRLSAVHTSKGARVHTHTHRGVKGEGAQHHVKLTDLFGKEEEP